MPIISFGINDCSFTPTNSGLELPQDVLDYAMTSADLSELSYKFLVSREIQSGNLFGFDRMQAFVDLDDMAILAEYDNICYVTFRGTVGANVFDVFQLFDAGAKMVNGCKVRSGFYNGYHARYINELKAGIADCMTRCSELILTGQSQGGSNALVAFMDLQEYNPIAITFGALRTVRENCTHVDSTRHYRFVNVGQGIYDYYAMMFDRTALHFGHSILLDATANAAASYLGLDDNRMLQPQSRDPHSVTNYWSALKSLVDAAMCNPLAIQISGWEDGHWCHEDDECDSGSCNEQMCIGALQVGEFCRRDYECASRRCEHSLFKANVCA
ncbi:expressed unknown protein [Seminavis robusta]|uniref:Fungal lipase-type domain-containing protein n=1 Tax=Seminavis robusta TaxID=568900 RepID=A0A9N8DZ80_9STRA|nr:expressed unknown protein [Seminavis robusta]|eukprot:Sro385_g131690.1 n/a (328) ;mRNA; r:46209-47192